MIGCVVAYYSLHLKGHLKAPILYLGGKGLKNVFSESLEMAQQIKID